jgi:hypothetical protein
MTKGYSDYIRTGQMTQMDAIKNQSVRDATKHMISKALAQTAADGLPADAAAFGALDIVAVKLVEWYGPAEAAEVFTHYAEVCGRQKPKGSEGGDV